MNTFTTRSRRSRSQWLAGAASAALGAALLVGPAAANAQRAGVAVAASPFSFSSVAWTGQNTVVAGTDAKGDLYCYVKPPGSAKLVTELVAPGTGSEAFHEPSIGWTGQALVIAAVDQLGDLVYFSADAGSPTWSEQTVATSDGGSFAFQDPSLTVANDLVLITSSTTSNHLESFTLEPDSTTWVESLVAGGPFTTSSATTAQGMAFVTASDGGTLYMWWEALTQPGWEKEIVASGDTANYYQGGSVSASAIYVWITASNSDSGSIVSYDEPIAGLDNNEWNKNTVTPSGVQGAPQIDWTGATSGFDFIAATTSSGALKYWWTFDGATPSWSPETIAASGTNAKYGTPAITVTTTSVDVADINLKSGAIYNWYQPFGTTPWYEQRVAKG
jgi:hypothetical protein